METRLLRYFITVAKEENISRAAKSLHMTQPTLSRQMMELEKEVGSTLFIRGNRRITLTEEGILLRKRAHEIIDLIDKTEAELAVPTENVSGNIYIGGGETYAMELIALVIQELKQEHPQIKFHIYSGNAIDVTDKLDHGLLDFGLLIGSSNFTNYESIELPATETWGILMKKDSELSSRKVIKAEDLWDLPLIISKQSLTEKELTNWLKKNNDELNIVATYNLVYNASILVKQGLGYALALDKLINTTGESNLQFVPLSPNVETKLNIVWKRNQVFPKAAELFLKKLKEHFEQN